MQDKDKTKTRPLQQTTLRPKDQGGDATQLTVYHRLYIDGAQKNKTTNKAKQEKRREEKRREETRDDKTKHKTRRDKTRPDKTRADKSRDKINKETSTSETPISKLSA